MMKSWRWTVIKVSCVVNEMLSVWRSRKLRIDVLWSPPSIECVCMMCRRCIVLFRFVFVAVSVCRMSRCRQVCQLAHVIDVCLLCIYKLLWIYRNSVGVALRWLRCAILSKVYTYWENVHSALWYCWWVGEGKGIWTVEVKVLSRRTCPNLG